jgi:hypothetical protein
MTEFQEWLRPLVEKYGTPAKLARAIRMSDAAVSAWVKGTAKPSRRGCKALSRETGIPALTIGKLAKSRYIGGVGNGEIEAERGWVEPEPESEGPSLKKSVLNTQVFPKCDGCDRYARPDDYAGRRDYYCRPLATAGLPPLCFEWSLSDVLRAEWMLLELAQ